MSESNNNLNSVLQDTADAIRDMSGGSEPITPRNFANAIRSIPTGGNQKYLHTVFLKGGNNPYGFCVLWRILIVNESSTPYTLDSLVDEFDGQTIQGVPESYDSISLYSNKIYYLNRNSNFPSIYMNTFTFKKSGSSRSITGSHFTNYHKIEFATDGTAVTLTQVNDSFPVNSETFYFQVDIVTPL